MKASNLIVVLVEPRHQGNIGAAARAMKNCGLNQLRLVKAPQVQKEAKQFAVHAADVLKKARRFSSLESAVKDCSRVVGFTAKTRKFGPEHRRLPDAAQELSQQTQRDKVALVFGREDHGLLNSEIALCTDLIKIPGAARWAVFNLSQAVLLGCYEIAVLAQGERKVPKTKITPSITHSDRARLIQEFDSLFSKLGYEKPERHNRSARMLARLSSQFECALKEGEDFKLWMGVLKRLQQRP